MDFLTGAGYFDLGCIQSASEIADRAGALLRIVLSRATFRTRLTGGAVLALRDTPDFIEPIVHARHPIMRAIESGRTVVEMEPDTPGAAEMRELLGGGRRGSAVFPGETTAAVSPHEEGGSAPYCRTSFSPSSGTTWRCTARPAIK